LQVAQQVQYRDAHARGQPPVKADEILLVGRQLRAVRRLLRKALRPGGTTPGRKPFKAHAQQLRELLQPLAARRGALRGLPLAAGAAGAPEQARKLGLRDTRLLARFTDTIMYAHAIEFRKANQFRKLP